VVQQVTKVVNNNVLQPTVIFAQGKSTIDAAQMASVAMIAKYMQNHPSSIILIKGYASPEGSKEVNQRISEARAQAVKEALVNRYKVSEKRLRVQGMGATDELFDEVDFNRVATFTDTTK
jgi:outer membrane protein OmpA-like peptidoglycan-associated protein